MAPNFTHGLWWGAAGILVGGSLVVSHSPVLAQIRPDASLGAERSRVTPDVPIRGLMGDRIDGGAIRGANLFHSFTDFNVRDLQRVYFSNPEAVENILTRVTGQTRSDIFGTLGVDGNANLFLINPNGIVFGPNAQLDIRGAFFASTGDRFAFADGSEFRATDPNAPPPVTVSIPIGVQFGPTPPAGLINEAVLRAGGNVTLSAGTVTNLGQVSSDQGTVTIQQAADILTAQPPSTIAIQPDTTLGSEQSQVTTNVDVQGQPGDRIDGGAIRGANLFHSFTAFNVQDSQRVYFANPLGVENILSRVTGNTRSDILGTLGVDGTANLFLLNPNGIIFGPNAQLDLRGSFLASTGDRFSFPDGSEFSARTPNSAPSITVSVPVGVQFGSEPPARIINQANLETERDLTLSARDVISTGRLAASQGQVHVEALGDAQIRDVSAQSATLQATGDLSVIEGEVRSQGDLTLQADQTVRLRDSVSTPLSVLSGGNLRIQGNERVDILALNHLTETPFQSLGDLILLSDGDVSGDSHFYSGGNFSILNLAGEPGTFISLYDPIVSSGGSVTFGAYTGPALKVEAIGSIEVTGDITITGADTTLSAARGNFSIASTGPNFNATFRNDGNTLSATELEVFFGLDAGELSGAPLNNGTAIEGSGFTTQFTTTTPNQTVSFNWAFSTSEGLNSTYNDFAFVVLPGIAPGIFEIADTAQSPSASATFSRVIPEAGTYRLGVGVVDVGDPSFVSSIQVNTFQLNGSSLSINTSADPDVAILASSPSLILRAGLEALANTPNVPFTTPPPPPSTEFTDPGNSPDPETITVTGSINTSVNDLSLPELTSGGSVILTAPGNITVNGSVNTSSTRGSGGLISITSGGNIDIRASDSRNPYSLNTSSTVGSGGDILLSAEAGQVRLQNVDALTDTTGSGSAGNITVQANRISLIDSTLTATLGSDSSSFDTQLFLFDNNGTLLASNDDSDVSNGAGGSLGLPFAPSLTRDSYLQYDFTTAGTYYLGVGAYFSSASSGDPDRPLAGNTLSPGNYSLHLSFNEPSLINPDRDPVRLPESEPNNARSAAQVINLNNLLAVGADPNVEASDQIPYVTIAATGNNTFDYYSFELPDPTNASILGIFDIDTGLATAGQISLIAIEDIELEGSQLDASTFGRGDGGSIAVRTNNRLLMSNGSSIRTTVGQNAEGNGGNILVNADEVDLRQGSSLNASNEGLGRGGDIEVTATTRVSLTDSSGIRTTVSSTGQGEGGDITINTPNLGIGSGSRLEAQTFGQANPDPTLNRTAAAGNITINAPGGIVNIGGGTDPVTGDPISGVSSSGLVSGVFTSTENPSSGVGGNITVVSDRLTLSDRSVFNALTRNASNSGNIDVTVTRLEVLEGSQLLTTSTTDSTGRAGDITIRSDEQVLISGAADTPVLPTSPFAAANITPIELTGFNTANNPNVELSDRIPFTTTGSVTGDGTFRYYSFGILTAGTRGIFDIDDAYVAPDGSSPESVDTQIFLFNYDTGELLASNDDSFTANGAGGSVGLPFFEEYSRDSYIRYNFPAPGRYVLGVARFPTFPTSGPITPDSASSANPINAPQTYTLNVSLQGQAPLNEVTLDRLNPNRLLTNNQFGSGLFAQAEGSGNAGTIRIETSQLQVYDGAQISASTVSGSGGAIIAEGLDTLDVRNSLIAASTDSGTAGRLSVSATQSVNLAGTLPPDADGILRGGLSAEAREANGIAGDLSVTTPELVIRDRAQIAASNVSALEGGSITLQNIDTLQLTNGGISASTETGIAGSIRINEGEAAADRVRLQNSRIAAEATQSGSTSRAGNVTINAQDIALAGNSAIATSNVSSDVPQTEQANFGNVQLNNVNQLSVTNSEISASTGSGVAGSVQVNATTSSAEAITLQQGIIQATATLAGGNAGSVVLNTQTLTADNSRISASNVSGTSGEGDVTIRSLRTLNAQNRSEISASTETGIAGNVSINPGGAIANDITLQNSRIEAEATGDNPNSRAGNVTINAQEVTLTEGGAIATSNISSDVPETEQANFGNIQLNNVNQLSVTNSEISASTGSGVAGSVQVNATSESAEAITLQQGIIQATATLAGGNAGSVILNTQTLTADNSQISASNVSGTSSDGDITIRSLRTLDARNGSEISASTQTGVAGSVRINPGGLIANTLTLQGSRIEAEATGDSSTSRAGNVTINAEDVTLTGGSAIATSNISSDVPETEQANFGNIQLNNVNQLTVTNSEISASTGSGVAGSVQVNATSESAEAITLQQGIIQATATLAGGNAGSVILNTQTLTTDNSRISASNVSGTSSDGDVTIRSLRTLDARNGSEISASTETGIAGNVSINPGGAIANDITLQNSRIAAEATGDNPNSRAGNVTINAQEVTLTEGGAIATSNVSSAVPQAEQANFGNIRLTNLDRLTVTNGVISASTGFGVAGSVQVNATSESADIIALQQGIIQATATLAGGNAGSVVLNTRILSADNSQISTSNVSGTSGEGDITIRSLRRLEARNGSEISASTETGVAGSVSINAGETAANVVDLRGSRIAAQATAPGNHPNSRAGNVTINAQTVELTNGGAIATSNVSSAVPANERARFGNIRLTNLNRLSVSGDESEISASTRTGVAGSVSINGNGAAANTVDLQGGRIAAEATGNSRASRAGNVTINARTVELSRGGAIATSNVSSDIPEAERENFGNIRLDNLNRLSMSNGSILASSRSGVAGNVDIGARRVEVNNASTIAASTRTGEAGNVTINASDELALNSNSQIEVRARGQNGRAGNLNLRTRDLFVNSSNLTVSSEQGFAGNLTIRADQVRLNQGRLTAESGLGDGANIDIAIAGNQDLSGFLWLENESLISASALENATGGRVRIAADFIFAFFPTGPDGSDIIANAIAGDGGTVDVSALGLFGIQFRTERTPLNDITASSEGGATGVVQLTTLGIDPSRGFTVVPLEFLDLTNLVGQSCSANLLNRASAFTVTGRGGVPLSPIDPLGATLELADWVTLPSESSEIEPPDAVSSRVNLASSIPATPRSLFCYSPVSSSAADRTPTHNIQREQ